MLRWYLSRLFHFVQIDSMTEVNFIEITIISEGTKCIFSKVTYLKSVHQVEKDGVFCGFFVKSFAVSINKRGLNY